MTPAQQLADDIAWLKGQFAHLPARFVEEWGRIDRLLAIVGSAGETPAPGSSLYCPNCGGISLYCPNCGGIMAAVPAPASPVGIASNGIKFTTCEPWREALEAIAKSTVSPACARIAKAALDAEPEALASPAMEGWEAFTITAAETVEAADGVIQTMGEDVPDEWDTAYRAFCDARAMLPAPPSMIKAIQGGE